MQRRDITERQKMIADTNMNNEIDCFYNMLKVDVWSYEGPVEEDVLTIYNPFLLPAAVWQLDGFWDLWYLIENVESYRGPQAKNWNVVSECG